MVESLGGFEIAQATRFLGVWKGLNFRVYICFFQSRSLEQFDVLQATGVKQLDKFLVSGL